MHRVGLSPPEKEFSKTPISPLVKRRTDTGSGGGGDVQTYATMVSKNTTVVTDEQIVKELMNEIWVNIDDGSGGKKKTMKRSQAQILLDENKERGVIANTIPGVATRYGQRIAKNRQKHSEALSAHVPIPGLQNIILTFDNGDENVPRSGTTYNKKEHATQNNPKRRRKPRK